ncbi:hypothetical protein [Streptomyces sp. NPDC020597]|uniref:hypothetical protein n=1 Tax=unclassified Streptomyces TaxID=2593676 RepID=UPI0037878772
MNAVIGSGRSTVGAAGGRVGEILWPQLFRDAPHVRSAAYGLAGLVLELSIGMAFDTYYWSDSNWTRHPLGWPLAVWMTPSIWLMSGALAGAFTARRGSVPRRLLSGLAWTVSVITSLGLLLVLVVSGADLCETIPPTVPAYLEPALMVPVCLAASLAIGSLAAAGAWAVTRHRIHRVALYAVWLATAGASVFLLLAPILAASPTCSPVVGG